ncbi:MAG: TraM recognition domain-containing protein [Candidatus Doudnabacteria bacterium]|nr:TraM recognition domain-containing protein [Candidatus Doudnabacteria bacterium]
MTNLGRLPAIQFDFRILIWIGVGAALLAVLGVLGYWLVKYILKEVKETTAEMKALRVTCFEVKVPEDNETEIKAADQMFSGLLGIGEKLEGMQKYVGARTFVSFEIVAFKDMIKFYVVCPNRIATLVDRQINGAYPTAQIDIVKEYNLFPDDAQVAHTALKLDKDSMIPVRTYEELATDTLSTLTDALSKLAEGESAAFQLVISPAGSDWRNKAKKYVEDMRKPAEEGKTKPKKIDEDTLSSIDRKAEKSGFYADIRLLAVSPSMSAAKEHLTNMLSAFDQYTKEGGNRFAKSSPKTFVRDFIYRIPRETMTLNTSELATVFHFPNRNIKTPHIQWLLAKDAPAADFVTNTYQPGYMWLGQNRYRGQAKDIFIKPEDRVRHMYVIGQTGSGKTKFIAGQAIRDIKAGRGVCFIDPHGSDTELILEQVPPERVEDVIYFNPGDTERPVGLNMLEFITPEQKTFVINEMLNIFDKLYDLRQTGGPIFEQYMRNSILLLMEDVESGNTLMEISRVLADEGYRKYKLSKATNIEVVQFWTKQAEKAGGDAALQNVVPYITSKLTSFVSNDIMRPIIAQQKSTIDFRWAMDNQKIVLINLSKGRIGDLNAYLLGMVIVGKILAATLSREDIRDEKDRVPFYLYIDEFQNFLTDSIVTILSEARKYGLSLNIAHQFLGQLNRKGGDTMIKDAIFGNVGTKVVMRVGIEDAQVFEKDFAPLFSASDITKQPNQHAYIKLLVDGKYPPPFSLTTTYNLSPFAQMGTPNKEIAQMIKQISRLRYGRDREVVEAEIKSRTNFFVEVKEEKKGGLGGLFGGASPF